MIGVLTSDIFIVPTTFVGKTTFAALCNAAQSPILIGRFPIFSFDRIFPDSRVADIGVPCFWVKGAQEAISDSFSDTVLVKV